MIRAPDCKDFLYGQHFSACGKKIIPLNSMWVDSFYWDFHWDFKNVPVGDGIETPIKSCIQKKPYYPTLKDDCDVHDNANFYFKVRKVSDEVFALEIRRELTNESGTCDRGIVVEAVCSFLGHRKVPDTLFLNYRKSSVELEYRAADMVDSDLLFWTFRCVIKVHELSIRHCENFHKQEMLLSKLGITEEAKKSMAFLLHRNSFENVFTGRQTHRYTGVKTVLIRRTLKFAEELEEKIKTEMQRLPFEAKTPLAEYLRYIFDGQEGTISKQQAIRLYYHGHKYGLYYLVSECHEFMMENPDNEDLIDLMLCAALTYDLCFLKMLSLLFVRNYSNIKKTPKYQTLLQKDLKSLRTITDAALRFVVLKDPQTVGTSTDLLQELRASISEMENLMKLDGRDFDESISNIKRIIQTPGIDVNPETALTTKNELIPTLQELRAMAVKNEAEGEAVEAEVAEEAVGAELAEGEALAAQLAEGEN